MTARTWLGRPSEGGKTQEVVEFSRTPDPGWEVRRETTEGTEVEPNRESKMRIVKAKTALGWGELEPGR